MEFWGNNNELYFTLEGRFVQQAVSGEAMWTRTYSHTGVLALLFPIFSFDSGSSSQGTIKIVSDRSPGNIAVLDDDDYIIKWVNPADESKYDPYRVNHKFAINTVRTGGIDNNFQAMVIWTETPTGVLTWTIDGVGVVASSQLLPSTAMGNPVLTRMSPNGEGIFTIKTLPYTSDLDVLDGAWIKITTTGYENVGAYLENKTIAVSTGQITGFALVEPNDSKAVNLNDFTSFQLQRQKDAQGLPTSDFRLFINESLGYIGASPYVFDIDINELFIFNSVDYFENNGLAMTAILWNLTFDENDGTIRIINKELSEVDGNNIIYLGRDPSTNTRLVALGDGSDVDWKMQIMFNPNTYTTQRFSDNDDLLVQCCLGTVNEVGPPPNGYETGNINYEIFCPPEYVINSVSSASFNYVIPQDAQTCDALIIPWCDDNKTNIVCSCLYPSDLPLLPDNSTITTYQTCFSLNCVLSGYIPIDQRGTDGKLECPSTTLCDELYNAEEIDGPIYTDAKSVISCVDPDPEPEPFDWMLLVYIGGGVAVLIAIIVGIVVGVSEGDKKKQKEERSKKLLQYGIKI